VRVARPIAIMAVLALLSCGEDPPTEKSSETTHSLDVSQLDLRWIYNVKWGEAYITGGPSGPIVTDSDKQEILQQAAADRDRECNIVGADGRTQSCINESVVSFSLTLCIHLDECSIDVVARETGWAPLITRYNSELDSLIAYLKSQSYPVESFRGSLQDIKLLQNALGSLLEDAVAGRGESIHIATEIHDRLTTLGSTVRTEEQVHLAEDRRTITALDRATARYQDDLNAVQAGYGDIAARHTAYRATESEVFAAITAIANEASTADLTGLASLKVHLGEQSDNENRAPQLLIVDAKRVLWELASIQSAYETKLSPYTAYLTEHTLPTLDHTSAPRTGMNNVVTYAENRIQRVNDAVRAIYDGIRRREAALSLVAVDAATRDQLRAVDNAARETAFLNDITARASAMWAAPPTGVLNLALQDERMTTMKNFLQLQSACRDLTDAATWRVPGCQKVSAEVSKINTYLNQTLPFTLRFGVQKMRTAGFNNTLLTDIEAKLTTGDIKQAVQLYDAMLRAGGNV
jgi:hypothetical protein